MLHTSRYNVLVGNDDETLLFNTASGAFATLDDAAAAAYGSGTWDDALAAQLEDAGFLTELTPEEELAALHARFETARHDHTQLTLALMPTYDCNYACPYCYEQDKTAITGKMGDRVIDGVLDFIEARHAEHAFSQLSIQWYGGDPSLALDVVAELSDNMISWCDDNGVGYDALILTNCNVIDEAAVKMLAENRVHMALLTIDGFEETHNKRRVAADGSNSYQAVIGAAKLFVAHGITVSAVMNVDRVNWPEYHDLRKMLAGMGVALSFGRLADCGHFYGTGAFTKPEFDLFTMAEYAKLEHDEFVKAGFDASTLRQLLASPANFCTGQTDDYYIIDSIGDVYKCDGFVGDPAYRKFSIFDTPTDEQLRLMSHDPFASAQCAACELLPLCYGNCNWERTSEKMQCHPLKITLPDYLRDYRSCFDVPARGFTRLA